LIFTRYSDPCTFATDADEIAPGTIIYVPSVKKYYIMEDECVECDGDWNKATPKYHINNNKNKKQKNKKTKNKKQTKKKTKTKKNKIGKFEICIFDILVDVDLWIGPDSATIPDSPLYDCEDAITVNSGVIIVNPDPNLAVFYFIFLFSKFSLNLNLQVDTTKIFINGVCSH
jgi:hypothetical protein